MAQLPTHLPNRAITIDPDRGITIDRVPALVPHRRHELTISDLLLVLGRRKKQIALTTLACLLLGLLVCLLMTPRYQAKGILEIQKTSADMLGLQSMMSGSSDGPSDALNANLDLQTQAEILQSDALALKVINDLHLEQTRDFQPKWSPIGWVMGLLSFSDRSAPKDAPGASLEDSPARRTRAVRTFAAHLKVEPDPGTRLIEISYLHSDPKVAAAVVNDLIHALKDYGFQTRYEATRESSDWLNSQLADIKQQAQDLEGKVAELQKDSGVYSLGTDSQGRDQVYSSTLDRLQQSTTALMTATSNRIMKGAVYQTVQHGDPELISMLAGGGMLGASAGVQNSFSLLQTLRAQQSTLQAQVSQDSSKFGTGYPKLADERAALDSVNKAIDQEVSRIGKRAENDYRAAEETENHLKGVYAENKSEAERLNDKTIDYNIAKQEADDSRGLYEDLFKRLKEAGVLAGFHSSNISVVEPGRIPARPARPNIPIYLGISVFAGLFLGICSALFTDSLDTRIQSVEGTEQLLNSPLLAILPEFRKSERGWLPNRVKPSLDLLDEPSTPFAEALRGLRTKLIYSHSKTLPCKVILVTSSVPGEGKSTISSNFAALLAHSGKRVLLVEADMRHPSKSNESSNPLVDADQLDDLLGIHASDHSTPVGDASSTDYVHGLSTELSALLSDPSGKLRCVTARSANGVEIIHAGPTPRFPAELLDSSRMRNLLETWKTQFDYIVLDSPPLLPVTDAAVLSYMADVTLLVARPGCTSRQGLRHALELLAHSHTRVGVVLNAVDPKSTSYSERYGYSGIPLQPSTEESSHA
jgi:polysaccharide biosynthesis transport protein